MVGVREVAFPSIYSGKPFLPECYLKSAFRLKSDACDLGVILPALEWEALRSPRLFEDWFKGSLLASNVILLRLLFASDTLAFPIC